MQTEILDQYIKTFTAFNEMPPQLESFIKGLMALNSNQARMRKFTFNDKFYTIMVPVRHFKGVNISTNCRKFLANSLLKKDIKTVSVYEFDDILQQVIDKNAQTNIPSYLFLNGTYNSPCRHTVIKYYSLDNPKS